jgi:Carboxypeptidase regulatory-like domain
MKKRKIILLLGILMILLILGLNVSRIKSVLTGPASSSPQTSDPKKDPAPAPQDAFTAKLNAFLLTPISFYGKVVDQHAKPIAEATVKTISQDSALGHGTDRVLTTDADGLFTLTGAHGSGLVVEVSKVGYHQLTTLQSTQNNLPPSHKGFAYALDRGDGIHQPDKVNPVAFMLYRPGVLEPLLTRPEVSWYLKEGGGSTVVPLHPDRNPHHSVKIDLWIEQGVIWWPPRPYDWKVEITPVEGKILPHNDPFPFEAPADGYELSAILNFTKTMPQQKWKDQSETSYYIRFNDNTYARILIECYAGEKSLITLKSWLNPKTGSRNLEPTGSNK